MLRIIWKQIVNRRKSNGWILLELLCVFCLAWYIVDFFFVLEYNRSLASHRDVRNTYRIDVGTLPASHAGYDTASAAPPAAIAHLQRVVARIKEYPDVESAGLCLGDYSLPGTGSFNGSTYRSAQDTLKTISIQRINFIAEEDYFKVFRHTSGRGGRPVSLADYDWGAPGVALVTRIVAETLFPGEEAVGKIIESTWVSPEYPREQYRIAGVTDDLKRFNYSRPHGVVFFPARIDESNYLYVSIAVRSRGHIPAARFMKEFRQQMSAPLRIGNYYLKNMASLVQVEAGTNYSFGITNTIRMHAALMAFFLVTVALCVLGAFLYRVNVRREEIGIRRAMGAGNHGIRWMFILEGLLLLSIAAIPAMIIEVQFISAGLIDTLGKHDMSPGDYLPDNGLLRFLITNLVTWLTLAGIIVPAILYPAWRAGRITPVEALRDE
ncbi:MAG: ABC transporter permease [Tannerellaceae bacterium]|jgi:hypothetical protein|nr:ABC transporter permease [Tannerellaceae bacterium]